MVGQNHDPALLPARAKPATSLQGSLDMTKRKIRHLLGTLLSLGIPTRYGLLLVLPTKDKASTYLAGKQGRGTLNVQMTTANKTLFNILVKQMPTWRSQHLLPQDQRRSELSVWVCLSSTLPLFIVLP
jgi:hypothetical protein